LCASQTVWDNKKKLADKSCVSLHYARLTWRCCINAIPILSSKISCRCKPSLVLIISGSRFPTWQIHHRQRRIHSSGSITSLHRRQETDPSNGGRRQSIRAQALREYNHLAARTQRWQTVSDPKEYLHLILPVRRIANHLLTNNEIQYISCVCNNDIFRMFSKLN
jgi:hypothetical protein